MKTLQTSTNIAGDPFVAQTLQERIMRGEYTAGSWLPAERALAVDFAVDRYTVRKALRRLEEQGLIIREPGKRPWVCPPYGAKRHGEANTTMQMIVAIQGQNTTNLNSSAILRGISAALHSKESPYRLLVADTFDPDPAVVATLERRALETIGQDGVAGAIIVPSGGPETLSLLNSLQANGASLVFVDRLPPNSRCDFVGIDNVASAHEAVQHLLDLGHRRIAHLTTREDLTTIHQREEGFREALREAQILVRPEWVYHARLPVDAAEMNAAREQFLSSEDAPTALFAVNDALAHRFIAEAESHGLSFPETMSVVGFDNHDQYSPRRAILTSVDQPFEQMGRHAVDLLLGRLAVSTPPALPFQHVLLPTRLVVRSTSRTL